MSFESELYKRFEKEKCNEYLGVNKTVNLIIPTVSVSVATYQHKNYIRECLNGIIMQKTDFPIEIIIGDDESSDGTTDICKEYAEKYPNIIRLFIRDRNTSHYYEGEKFVARYNGIWCRMSCRGKYIALCEGDDYWTDPLKLQKQVDFLESHPTTGMVYTKCIRSDTKKIMGKNFKKDEIFWSNPIPTLTTLISKNEILEYEKSGIATNNNWLMGDYPLWLWIHTHSKIDFINSITGVYRVLKESASHSQDGNKRVQFNISSFQVANFFAKDFLSKNQYEKFLNDRIFSLVMSCIKHKSYLIKEVLIMIEKIKSKKIKNIIILLMMKRNKVTIQVTK